MDTTLKVGDVIVQHIAGRQYNTYTVVRCTKTQAIALCKGIEDHHKRFRIHKYMGGMVQATGGQERNVFYTVKE